MVPSIDDQTRPLLINLAAEPLAELEYYAANHGVSREEAARQILVMGLALEND